MYDEVLGKKGFWEVLKQEGKSEEEITVEWEKLVGCFEVAAAELGYQKLTEEEKKKVKEGLDPEGKLEDAGEMFRRIAETLKSDPNRVGDSEKMVAEAVEKAYYTYANSLS